MAKNLSLTEGKVSSTLIRFAIPFLLASLLQVLYGAVDTLFMSLFSTPAAISGVASGSMVMNLVSNLFMGLTMGGTVLIGQYIGAKRDEDTAKTVGNVVVLFAIVSVVVTVLVLTVGKPILQVLKVPTETSSGKSAMDEAASYLFVCGWGTVFIMGYNVVSAILRGMGNSKAPMYFIAAGCATNVLADYILVGPLGMGATGAALATVGSQAISLILAIIYIRKKGFAFAFGKRHLKLEKAFAWRIIRIGVPASLQNTLITISFMLILTVTNMMGEAASAGAGVVNKIIDCSMMIPASFGSAITTISAQNIGAGKPKRAKQSMMLGVLYSLVFAIPFCLLINIRPEAIMSILAKDQQVIAEGAKYLIPFSWDCVLVCFVFCFNGLFNGCGKTAFVMFHNIATTFLVRIPIVYFLGTRPGATLFHVGLGTPAASLVSLVLCLIYYRVNFANHKLEQLRVVE